MAHAAGPLASHRLTSHRLHAQTASSGTPLGLSLRPPAMPLRVPNPRAYAAAKAAAQHGYQAWLARHPQAGSTTTIAPRLATPSSPRSQAVLFEGLNQGGMLGGGLNTSSTPPDTTGAIGPNYYIEMVNSEIRVYNRSTLSAVTSTSEDSFVKSTSTCDGQIRWDQQAERWEYASLDCGFSGEEGFSFGWSKTSEPGDLNSTSWCMYHVNTDFEPSPGVVEKILFDYPKLGGSDEYLLIGYNAFAEKTKPGEEYVGSGVVTIPKPAKGRATCPSGSEVKLSNVELPDFTPVPANVYGSSNTGYVVASEYPETGSANKVRIYTVTKNGSGEPEWHTPTTVSVSSYVFPPEVPQPLPSTDKIDSSDTRLTQAVAAEDPASHQMNVWTQHTVSTTSGLPSVVAWYELKAGSTAPVQVGTVEGSTGDFAFNAAISPTARGNGAVINYNVGGANQEVELLGESRSPLTKANEMEGETTLATSEGVDSDFSCPSVTKETAPCRWGDYAGASPDPLHRAVVWGTGEFNGEPDATTNHAARWKTKNFALALRAESEKPTAAFSVTTVAPTGGSPVEFDASASSDPNESIVAYEWSFGDGTTGTGENPQQQHTYSRPGKYPVSLTVMDNAGLTSAPVMHEVTVADAPPVASFVIPSPTANVPVTFNGSASHDPDGTIASYEWNFGDGTPVQTGATPTHTFASVGHYMVKLKVTDDGGLTNTIEQEVTVTDSPPVASIVAPSSTTPGASITFDGSGSYDPDGTIASYEWNFGDGPAVSYEEKPVHAYAAPGEYTVTLTVTDNKGLSTKSTWNVTVDAPPVASFTWSPSSPTAASAVSFDGSASEDSDGRVTTYKWDFGDGTSGSGEKPTHTYAHAGKYIVTLSVIDNAGLTSTPVTHEVTVADTPPTASFVVGSASPTATTSIGFNGSTSTDADGSIANYAWTFGDGGTASGAAPSHTYATPGQYSVTLTVTDNGGKTASVTHVVNVADAAPTAAFSVGTSSPIAGTLVGFNGSGSADADGSVASYSWSFGDGTSGSGPAPSHVYTKAGAYAVKLTVTDNGGLSASTERTIAVGPEPNAFAVVAVKPNKRNGSVALSVRVLGPGVLTAVDAASVRQAKATSKATLLTLLARIFGFADPSAEAAKKAKPKHKPKRKPALVKPARLAVPGAGTVTIQMALTAAGKAELLRHHGKLTVKLSLKFAPTYGSPASKTQVIRPAIVKARRKKRRR